MWDHDLPVGIAPTEDEQALPTNILAPVEDALGSVSYLPIVRILSYYLWLVS